LICRRIYYFAGYFLFLYNAVIGVFSVLKRVLFSLVIGTLCISRLDYVLLMRGFERLDSGNDITVNHQMQLFYRNPVLFYLPGESKK